MLLFISHHLNLNQTNRVLSIKDKPSLCSLTRLMNVQKPHIKTELWISVQQPVHSPLVSSASVHHPTGRRACSWPLCKGWLLLHTRRQLFRHCTVVYMWLVNNAVEESWKPSFPQFKNHVFQSFTCSKTFLQVLTDHFILPCTIPIINTVLETFGDFGPYWHNSIKHMLHIHDASPDLSPRLQLNW